jgi:hypothetical protein
LDKVGSNADKEKGVNLGYIWEIGLSRLIDKLDMRDKGGKRKSK